MKESFPPMLALTAVAVTQPLLDLFGKNPEFFVASDMTKSEVLAFAVSIAFVIPLIGLVLVLIAAAVGGRRAAQVTTGVLVGLLAFGLGLTVARQFGFDRVLLSFALGAFFAGAVTALRIRWAGFGMLLRYLAVAPLAFLGLFIFASESSALLFEGEAAPVSGVIVGRPAPIAFVVLDEVPVSSLMRPDGTINDERFPNFARLAEAGTWYRNASAVSPNTPLSVPTILDGDLPPSGGLPTSADHPDNLFTLLAENYELDVTETVTELCPESFCGTGANRSLGGFLSRVSRSMSDAAVVYGHTTLPRRFRDDLPAIDQSWGGFIDDTGPGALKPADTADDDDAPSNETSVEFLLRQNAEQAGQFPELSGETLREAIAGSSIDGDRDLLFVHEVFPHFPWERTPTGASYDSRPGPPGRIDGTWGFNDFLVTQALQRHLLQLGYADVALGELIDKLEADGVWNDALVVVVADHGVSFVPGEPARSPIETNHHAVYRVPLLIKSPGGEGGVIDDEPARTMDILPTIVDLLEIETEFEFDGVSLVGDVRPEETPVAYGAGPQEVGGGVDDAVAIATRNAQVLPHGDGWRAVAAPGAFGALVGESVADLSVTEGPARRWSIDQADQLASVAPGVRVPLILTGDIDATSDDPAALLIALNGTVAGVVGFENEPGSGAFSVLLDESAFVEGPNKIELLAVDGARNAPRVVSLGPPPP